MYQELLYTKPLQCNPSRKNGKGALCWMQLQHQGHESLLGAYLSLPALPVLMATMSVLYPVTQERGPWTWPGEVHTLISCWAQHMNSSSWKSQHLFTSIAWQGSVNFLRIGQNLKDWKFLLEPVLSVAILIQTPLVITFLHGLAATALNCLPPLQTESKFW